MSKLNKAKYYISGVLTGAVLFSGIALAANPIKLIVNGQQINSDVPPQVINGRTMIPARPLAEALGATVEWDAKNNAVMITSNNAPSKNVASVDLVNTLKPYKLHRATIDTVTVTGKSFTNAYLLQDEGEVNWNLDGQYKKLTLSTGVPDDDTSGYKIIIYGDGKEIKSEYVTTKDGLKELTVNVTGVKTLTVEGGYVNKGLIINPRVQ
ncbi:stalk domain-containing protein [Aneurinibacillus thermoaerophilus]|uniref:stalk domain-containing protein n=1 Tax=Aneurinibacillus thermoaerophilus TaxID=143495 RepID=UPI002E236C39|nr:stalk domain-containing protein [Aneurinibacillus thermoaerophilus]MED0760946.1 stalk domain-containing protein [Aneurinibacillus thermoaerophilus]